MSSCFRDEPWRVEAATDVGDAREKSTVPRALDVALDGDGIARLVPFAGAQQAKIPDFRAGDEGAAPSAPSSAVVEHSSSDGGRLSLRIQEVLAVMQPATIHLTGHCEETEMLEISSGEVLLRGCIDGNDKARLVLPGVRVTGGLLQLDNVELCASEENSVHKGELRCTDCFITSRNGCGVLCLQGSKVHLSRCQVAHCLRSGIGVNGKNAELVLDSCVVRHNNFSGIGINHQARKIQFNHSRITENGYHGVWLNAGVVATLVGGDLSGNRLADKDGPGTLIGLGQSPTAPPPHKLIV